ncbi:MAG: type II secretion system protein [Alphaproteobacteria bacterium]
MRQSKNLQGFTLIEFAIVITISGLLMAAAIQIYYVYLQSYYYRATIEKINTISTSISSFTSVNSRLPCPSDPTIPLVPDKTTGAVPTDQSGMENCAIFAALAINTCDATGSYCKMDGARDTLADSETVNMDPIYIGGLPYKTIKSGLELGFISGPLMGGCFSEADGTPADCDADSDGNIDAGVYLPGQADFEQVNMSDALDPWGYQFGYAVTEAVTNKATYGKGLYGAIAVQTEDGVSLLSPQGNANYVVISFGDNHKGAFTSYGKKPIPCTAGTTDAENCDNDSLFVSGLRVMGPGADYYDDYIQYSSVTISSIWEFVGTGSDDIFNVNVGNVGVGTTADPTEKLEVNGGVRVTAGGAALQDRLCDQTGGNCWSPDLLAHPQSGTFNNNNACPTAAAGFVNVMVGLQNGAVQCTTVPIPLPTGFNGQTCATAGEFVTGFSSSGLICGVP